MKRVASALITLALGVLALAGWGVLNARATPVVRSARVELSGWPPGAPGVTLALLSDIHIGNIGMDRARLRAIVEQINQQRPDLVLIAGDLVVGHESSDRNVATRAELLSDELSRLEAPLGVVVVFGNHDYWTAPDDIRAALAARSIPVLENASMQRGPIVVVGVADAFSEHDDIERALSDAEPRSGPLVVLTHTPDIAPQLPQTVQLVLAGHTHCGQIVTPLFGDRAPPRSPKAGWKPLYDPRYRCGLIQDQHRSVVVTAGLGSGTVPMRFGAPPDWWLIELGASPGG